MPAIGTRIPILTVWHDSFEIYQDTDIVVKYLKYMLKKLDKMPTTKMEEFDGKKIFNG